MAFTAQEKQALATWLEANIHKAVHAHIHREGIKQTIQVTDPIDGATYDKEIPVLDPETGARTFNEVSADYLFFYEVILRVQAKAIKHGYDPDEEAVRALLFENRAAIKSWLAPGVTITDGRTLLSHTEILAEDPDA